MNLRDQSANRGSGCAGREVVEAHVAAGEHFGQHDDLTGMHRKGKRNLNSFPFLCLQTCWIQVDGFLTGSHIGETVWISPPSLG